MPLVLYPRAAPSDRLRVWVGAFQRTAPPALTWQLNGTPQQPTALRPISSVRTDEMLPTPGPQQLPRAFTGVYEFTQLKPDTRYVVHVRADQEAATLDARTLPDAVPTRLDQWFHVLLVSCFHQAEDRGGLAGEIVSALNGPFRPHLTLLMGDQVYLDLPTLYPFPNDLVGLAEKFEADYTRNWLGPLGYSKVLAAAPSISTPDDHEYWNNYPHTSVIHPVTYSSAARAHWSLAAQAMYEGFQLPIPATIGGAVVLDVPPVSFCVADTRSGQDPARRWAMPDGTFRQVEAWVDHVIDRQLFGVFTVGQSLFVHPADIKGKVTDYELADYRDFGRTVGALKRLVDAKRPLICLTGDVHWGRVVAAQDIMTGRTALYEIISSPASLVTTLGRDQWREGKAWLAEAAASIAHSLFGRPVGESNPWPRHSEVPDPPPFFASEILEGRFRCTTLHRQRGNQVALMSFKQSGEGLDFRITYWPISADRNIGRRQDVGPFHLPSHL
jgi:hypothetical protein